MGKRYKVRTGEGTPEFDYDSKLHFRFKGVDLIDGTTFEIDGIDDLENNVIVFNCRYCNKEYNWDKETSTEDQWSSGLCKNCLIIEQQKSSRKEFEYIQRIRVLKDPTGKFIIPPKDQEWEIKYQDGTIMRCAEKDVIPYFCHTEEELKDKYKKLLFNIQDGWKLIKFEESHIENYEIKFADQDSIFFKIIKNRDMEEELKRMIRYENWKLNNFDILIRILSECSEYTNEQFLEFLTHEYPDSTTPGGVPWTIQAVRYLREYIDQIPKDLSREWEKWEYTIRMMMQFKDVLIAERYLIFKNEVLRQFSYQEIDTLIRLEDNLFLIDAKYKGGDVNPEKAQIYITALEKLGYPIRAVLFITAEDRNVKRLAERIYTIPYMWFKIIYKSPNKDKMLVRILKAIAIADDIHRRQG